MKRTWWRLGLSFFAGALVTASAVLFLWRAIADAKPPAWEPPNSPVPANYQTVEAVIADYLPYVSKSGIETPTEQLLAAKTVQVAVPPGPAFVNPKVEPGKVRWHKDFDAACRAAKKSGKPVLLFQMMGKLDDRFC